MKTINIFKIQKDKIDDLINELNNKYTFEKKIEVDEYRLKLYLSEPNISKITYKWILSLFDNDKKLPEFMNKPNVIVFISNGINNYAVPFNYAHHLLHRYADRNFSFDYASRIEIKSINASAITNNTSKKVKTYSSYKNFNSMEFIAGDSFQKLKVKTPDFIDNITNESIEIGTSVKFNINDESLENMIILVRHIEKTLEKDEVNKIPLNLCLPNDMQDYLSNDLLENKLLNEDIQIHISDFNVIGTALYFPNENCMFKYKYKNSISIAYCSIEISDICNFINENDIINTEIINIKILIMQDDESSYSKKIIDVIEYCDEENRQLLTNGKWYQYNNTFIEFIDNEIEKLETVYDCNFDYSYMDVLNYQKKCFINENGYEFDDTDSNDREKFKKIANTYYNEFAINNIICENTGWKLLDRELTYLENNQSLEIADIISEDTLFSVKIGNSSSSLAYVIDQSLESINYLHSINELKKYKNAVIWIMLKKKNKTELKNGEINLKRLSYIILKSKIVEWSRKCHILGMNPIIRINYFEGK